MNINLIVAELRQHCAVFQNRVAGAAEFVRVPETTKLPVPCAYVIPQAEQGEEQISTNAYQQTVKETFSVMVAVSNEVDEKGQTASAGLNAVRGQLFRALLGWVPEAEMEAVEYDGGQMTQLDRSRLWYQYDFSTAYHLSTEDTRQGADLAALPEIALAHINVDAISPMADPNLAYPGPDGRIEQQAEIILNP